jgi:hypothetical protein
MACYVSDAGRRCGIPGGISKLIIVGRYMAEDEMDQVLAHELGHHAGAPQRNDPTTYGHEEYDPKNYMGFNKDPDHYRPETSDA